MHVHACLPRSTFKDFKLVASKWPLWEHSFHKVLPTINRASPFWTTPRQKCHNLSVASLTECIPPRGSPSLRLERRIYWPRLELEASQLKARTANLLGGFLPPEHRAPHRIQPHKAKQTPGHLPSLHKIANGPKMSEIGGQCQV